MEKRGKWKLNASIETLVNIAADPDPLCGPLVLAEIEERLLEVKTTALAVRYLLPRNEEDCKDALEGLFAVCLRARESRNGGRGLYLNPPHAEDKRSDIPHRFHLERWFHRERRPAMRLFIEGELEKIFRPYLEREPKEIIAAALAGKFRYIGRTVRFRIIDEIRRYKRRKAGKKERQRRKQGAQTFNDLVTVDTGEQDSPPARPEPWDFPRVCAVLKKSEDKFRSALGEKNWETLLCFAGAVTDEPETRRGQKGRLTRLLAERRGVTPRQARADKKRLRKRLSLFAQASKRK